MRFTVVVLLISISCCCAPYPDERRSYGQDFYRDVGFRYRQRRPRPRPTTPHNPGTTPENMDLGEEDERLADEIGLRIPSDECVTSWDDFKDYVRDKEWIQIYGADDPDADINPGTSYKNSIRWKTLNESVIRREASLVLNNRCVFLDGLFRRVRPSDNLAIFSGIVGDFVTTNRQDYFVCSKQKPVRFCFFFLCYDMRNNREGRCRTSELALDVREQRTEGPNPITGIREQPITLNDIPWFEIEYILRKCFGQQFSDDKDPKFVWTWKNQACPVPGTPAFKKGVAMSG